MRSDAGIPPPIEPFDVRRLVAGAPAFAREWSALPEAPHLVVDDFLDPAWLAAHDAVARVRRLGASGALEEFRYYNTRSAATAGRAQLPGFVQELVGALSAPPFLAWLSEVTGIPGLVPDPELANGGLHFMSPGGFVQLHRDELIHPYRPNLLRRLNLLFYFNEGWREEYGGHFELWSPGPGRLLRRILPAHNRLLVTAIDRNVHGVPEPVRCPPGDQRKALILWYYTDEARPVAFEPAVFFAPPGTGLGRRVLTRVESHLFGAYQRAKRVLHLSNRAALALMRLVGYGRAG